MFPNSLRARLIFGAVVWVSIGMGVSGVLLAQLFRTVVTAQFDHDLVDHLDELAALVRLDPNGAPSTLHQLSDARFLSSRSGFYWQARADGALVRSPSLDDGELPQIADTAPEKPVRIEAPIGTVRVLQKTIDVAGTARPLQLTVGLDERLITEDMRSIHFVLVFSLAVIALGLIAAAYMQIEFGLRPLARIRNTLTAVRAGTRDELPSDLPTEIAPLVSDLNALIAANRQMVRRARLQAGKFAHAMKTPLTVLMDEARALEKAGHRAPAQAIIDQCLQMQLQIDYQTARARASARENPGAVTEVGPVVRSVIAAVSQLDRYRAISFVVSGTENVAVAADPQDLHEILGNIVDNGAKWARSRVSATIQSSGDRVRISVEDDGPGIPPQHWEAVFKVGERLDPTAAGSGLGLAIARDLAVLYRGAAWIDRSDLGGVAAHVEIPKTVAV